MSDFAVVAHEAADGARAAEIIARLREAGVDARGDAPVGDPLDPALGQTIDSAWLLIALWSRHSTDREGSQALYRAAEAPAQRGAYLGVLLDGSQVPFGFGGLDTVDMGGWTGGQDKALAALVEKVKRRMASGPAGSGLPEIETTEAAQERRKRSALLAGGAAAAILLAALAWFFLFRTAPSARAAIDTKLAAIPCAWLKVDPVDDGANGLLALTGVADQPDRAGETIRGLVPRTTKVTTDRIARIGSNECPAIDVPRRLRRDEGGRLRIVSTNVGRDQHMGLAEARVVLDFRGGDTTMALFGIEPSGKVTWILPDFAALDELKREDVGLVHDTPKRYEFTLRSDHLGWTGLLLVTGDRPLPGNKAQYSVIGSHAFGAWLQRATDHGDWQTEMTWYRIQSR